LLRDAVRADAMILQLWQTHLGWQDASAVIAEARRVLGCLQSSTHAHRPVLVLSPERQAWLLLELASAEMWAGDLDSAAVHVDEALLSARASDHPGLLALGLGHRAVGELLKSNARGAADTAAEGLTHAQRTGSADRCFTDRSHITLAWASYLRLEFDQAFESLSRIDLDAPGQVDTTVSILSSVLHAALLLEQGRLDEAQRELADPVGAAAALPSYLDRALALTRWRCASARGDGDAAAAEVRVLTKLGFDGDADVLSALARAELGDVDAGLETLSRVLTAAGPTDQASLARAATARTALLLLNGDRNAAQIAVLDVLARTAPQELLFFLTIGLLAGRDFLDLLADETKRAGAHPFAARALRSLREYVANRPHAIAASSPEIARAERRVRSETVDRLQPKGIRNRAVVVNGVNVTLTEREIDVLEQLALGSSYHEIGLALFITENTVKTHLASLYRKLGVERRSAALRVARDLGLV
jgi:ATP/maltotriose-dependent transcriptional regulator MalT